MSKWCVKICLIGEVSSSLSGMRREERNRCSLTTNQCHQYSYVVESVSCVDLYTEARLKERLIFQRCADLSVDDGGDKMVTTLNRFVTRCSHREILFALTHIDVVDIRIVLCFGCDTDRYIKKFDCAKEVGAR